jgi:hypothetical protein
MARSTHVIVALAGCAAAAALLACAPARWPAVAACRAPGLLVTLNTAAAGVAAGSEYLPVDFTNGTWASCRMDGYPGVAFVTGPGGHRIGGLVTRYAGLRARPVVLAPGETAHAWLIVAAASNYPPARCRPVAARWLRVRAPRQRGYDYVQHSFLACAHASTLTVQPVRPGRGMRGTGWTRGTHWPHRAHWTQWPHQTHWPHWTDRANRAGRAARSPRSGQR